MDKAVVAVIVFVLSMILLCRMCTNMTDDYKKEPLVVMTALKSRSEEAIANQLRAPSTAKFSDITETEFRTNDSIHFIVIGHVDAQNNFGAFLRHQYLCKLHRKGDIFICDTANLY